MDAQATPMKVVGFAGESGAGKTGLVEKLIGHLKARGLRVSVVKHAHHSFDVPTADRRISDGLHFVIRRQKAPEQFL